MKVRLRLDTMGEIQEFHDIVSKLPGKITLTDGNDYRINAKSLLGKYAAMEWERIECESENDIYMLIKKFVVE